MIGCAIIITPYQYDRWIERQTDPVMYHMLLLWVCNASFGKNTGCLLLIDYRKQ